MLGKTLILPEVFEPVRCQGRVADRGHDRSVAEIGLDGAMDRLAALIRWLFRLCLGETNTGPASPRTELWLNHRLSARGGQILPGVPGEAAKVYDTGTGTFERHG